MFVLFSIERFFVLFFRLRRISRPSDRARSLPQRFGVCPLEGPTNGTTSSRSRKREFLFHFSLLSLCVSVKFSSSFGSLFFLFMFLSSFLFLFFSSLFLFVLCRVPFCYLSPLFVCVFVKFSHFLFFLFVFL